MILEILKAAVAQQTGNEVAEEVVKNIQAVLGGQRVYIPAKDIEQRNADIKKFFNGRNHAEVCQMFDICLATLYRVVGR